MGYTLLVCLYINCKHYFSNTHGTDHALLSMHIGITAVITHCVPQIQKQLPA